MVAQSICAALGDANLGVQVFDESERHYVLWLAVGDDTFLMTNDYLCEFLARFPVLPLQACAQSQIWPKNSLST